MAWAPGPQYADDVALDNRLGSIVSVNDIALIAGNTINAGDPIYMTGRILGNAADPLNTTKGFEVKAPDITMHTTEMERLLPYFMGIAAIASEFGNSPLPETALPLTGSTQLNAPMLSYNPGDRVSTVPKGYYTRVIPDVAVEENDLLIASFEDPANDAGKFTRLFQTVTQDGIALNGAFTFGTPPCLGILSATDGATIDLGTELWNIENQTKTYSQTQLEALVGADGVDSIQYLSLRPQSYGLNLALLMNGVLARAMEAVAAYEECIVEVMQ